MNRRMCLKASEGRQNSYMDSCDYCGSTLIQLKKMKLQTDGFPVVFSFVGLLRLAGCLGSVNSFWRRGTGELCVTASSCRVH